MFDFSSFAQTISIELSLKWENKKKNICGDYQLARVPYLELSYRNNSCDSLYFFKIIDDLYFTSARSHGFQTNKKDLCLDDLIYHENERYKVIIGGNPLFYFSEIFEINEDINDASFSNDINDHIQQVYSNVLHKKDPERLYLYQKEKIDISEKNLTTSFKNLLVFLKPKETFVQTFDLSGFFIIGGSYKFVINKKRIDNFIEISPLWDESKKEWYNNKKYLPLNVNGYSLFSGDVDVATLNVVFNNKNRLKDIKP